MQKKRRVLFLILALLLAVSLLPLYAFGEDAAVIKLESSNNSPKSGEEFTVTVSIEDNPGFNAIQFVLSFDKTKLECQSASAGKLLKGSLNVTNESADEGAIIAAASVSLLDGDGVIAVYTFKALKDITELKFSIKDAILADSDGNDIAFSVDGAALKAESKEEDTEETEKETDSSGTESVSGESSSGTGSTGSSSGSGSSAKADSSGSTAVSKEKVQDANTSEQAIDTTSQPETGAYTVSFTDTGNHWAKEYISKAVSYNLFKGYEDGSFGPDDNITRSQFVTVLYRMAGSPEASLETPFTDISGEIAEFQKAIAWAYENKYVKGTTVSSFAPNAYITRQEAMKILFGYSGGQSGAELLLTGTYDSGFTDSGSIADWSKAAMYWGYGNGIISGTSANTLGPEENTNRGQVAKILVNYVDEYLKKGVQ